MRFLPEVARHALVALLLTASVGACASQPARDDSAQLALYRAHAGAPVRSFHFFGSIDSWTPLGDRAVAVWTRPSQAWLLDLDGTCSGLDFAPAIGLTSSSGTVSARFDRVLVRDKVGINFPCVIATIRPLDVPALKAAEREQRAARTQDSGT